MKSHEDTLAEIEQAVHTALHEVPASGERSKYIRVDAVHDAVCMLLGIDTYFLNESYIVARVDALI